MKFEKALETSVQRVRFKGLADGTASIYLSTTRFGCPFISLYVGPCVLLNTRRREGSFDCLAVQR